MQLRASVIRILGMMGLGVGLVGSAWAQEAPASPPWRFQLTPIAVWGMGIKGPVTIRNRTQDLDVTFDELFDHLQGSFGINFGANKGRWGGAFGLSYLKIGQDSVTSAVTPLVDVNLKWLTVEASGSYAAVAKPEVVVTVLAGVRYTSFKGTVEDLDGNTLAEGDGINWTDPFIGASVVKPIGEAKKFSLSLKGDVGGFDISESTSKLTWTVFPAAAYRFPISGGKRNLVLSAGYRFTSVEFTGEGPDVVQMDVDMQGPTLGLTFVF
jgi:hypothetical protein